MPPTRSWRRWHPSARAASSISRWTRTTRCSRRTARKAVGLLAEAGGQRFGRHEQPGPDDEGPAEERREDRDRDERADLAHELLGVR